MIVRHELDREQQWFAEARLGMFIHFGIYALLGRGEWVMYHEDIPREEYEKLAEQFNPSRFDADDWVLTAKECNCRYMTVTAKHHDGFCMFDSSLTDYKITNTPFGRDLIGELIDACHRHDMRISLYYSQPDWHHPNVIHRPGAFKDLQYERPGDEPDWPAYIEYYHGQIEELCSNYGRIDGIWFDGSHRTEEEWQGRKVYEMIRRLQPTAVVNDRAGYGDFHTPERTLANAAAAAGFMVEATTSISANVWGYAVESMLHSSPWLLHNMLATASAGGNFLLNVGPMPDGTLPQDWMERLRDIGRWLDLHGEAVFGTVGCPPHVQSDEMLCTRRGERLYLHLPNWPANDTLALPQLKKAPSKARLLGTDQPLALTTVAEAVTWSKQVERVLNATAGDTELTDNTVVLRGLPSRPPDPLANVLELVFEDEEMLAEAPPEPRHDPVPWDGEEPLRLAAEDAELSGFGLKGAPLSMRRGSAQDTPALDDSAKSGALGSGWHPEQVARWTVDLSAAVRCGLAVELACPEQFAGGRYSVNVGDQSLEGLVPTTGSSHDFVAVELGDVELPEGRTEITLSPTALNMAYHFADVRGIILLPL